LTEGGKILLQRFLDVVAAFNARSQDERVPVAASASAGR
jgi:hypothetical protein